MDLNHLLGIRPHIREELERTLLQTTGCGCSVGDVAEVYIRALVSVSLAAGDGDRARAAAFMDAHLFPALRHFPDSLAEGGGQALAVIANGRRLN